MAKYKPKEVPGFWQSLNVITNLVESTCIGKWHVFIETAVPATGAALFLLIIPSPAEILEEYLHPGPRRHGLKGRPKRNDRWKEGKTGKLRKALAKGIPDVDELIAERIPGRDIFKGRQAGSLERWVWFGIDILDRIGWYWLLFEAADTLITKWASGIMESRFCQELPNAMLVGEYQTDALSFWNAGWPFPGDLDESVNLGWNDLGNGTVIRQNTSIGVSGPVSFLTSVDIELTDPSYTGYAYVTATVYYRGGGAYVATSAHCDVTGSGHCECAVSIDAVDIIRVTVRCYWHQVTGGFKSLSGTNTIMCLTSS
jgi:hypothetical protein